jgi:hypothetical protein
MLEELPERICRHFDLNGEQRTLPDASARTKEKSEHAFRGGAAIPQITKAREFPKNRDVFAVGLLIFQGDRDGS